MDETASIQMLVESNRRLTSELSRLKSILSRQGELLIRLAKGEKIADDDTTFLRAELSRVQGENNRLREMIAKMHDTPRSIGLRSFR